MAPAAAAKSLQSCPTLCDPIDDSPPGSAVPGILQARTLEWVAIFFSNAWKWEVKVKLLSHDPIDGSPPGSAVPGILQARTLEWGAIAFSVVNGTITYMLTEVKPPESSLTLPFASFPHSVHKYQPGSTSQTRLDPGCFSPHPQLSTWDQPSLPVVSTTKTAF